LASLLLQNSRKFIWEFDVEKFERRLLRGESNYLFEGKRWTLIKSVL